MIQERFMKRVEEFAAQLGCSPEQVLMENTRLLEVLIAEGNLVYGLPQLRGTLEKLVKDRRDLLHNVEVLQERQQENMARLEEARIVLASTLVTLRKHLRLTTELAPVPTPNEIGDKAGYIRVDGSIRAGQPSL